MDFSREPLLPLLVSPQGTKPTFKLVRDQIPTPQGLFMYRSLPSPSFLFFIQKQMLRTLFCGEFFHPRTLSCVDSFISSRTKAVTLQKVHVWPIFKSSGWRNKLQKKKKGSFVLYLTSSEVMMMAQSCLPRVVCSPWAKCQPGREISRKGADKHCLL